MSTELSNGVIIPEEYSDDWYDEMSINLRKLNDVITAASDNATDIQRLDTDKANQSDLTALSGRVSQNETDIIALQTAVSGALKREIVQSLPTEDISTTTIYMIRNSQSSGTNIYDEYMYINSQWELIGTSATDFSNYYTKNETDNLLSAKANQTDLTSLSGRVTQTETDITALQTAVSGALKREIVQSLPTQDISTTTIYMIRNTTTSGDNIYDEYMYINNLWELIGTSATDFSNYYTKTEIDTLLSGKQASLSQTQLDAVNSGIDSSKVQQIATNTSDISSLQSGKANDSDVVHKSGEESIIGNKRFGVVQSFTGYPTIRLYSTIDDINVLPPYPQQQDIRFTDKNNNIIAYFIFQHRTDASEPFRTCWRQVRLDGTDNYYSVNFNNFGEFYPENNNGINLGRNGNRWKSVYATNYYYGSNNVEFSTKFVTTDTAQTISDVKTFTNTIKSKKEIELTGNRLAYILPEFSAGYSGLSLCTYGSNGAVKIGVWKVDDNDSTKHVLDTSLGYLSVSTGSSSSVNIVYLIPRNTTNSKLGDSTNKWKEINGLTPSSLSFPSDRSARIDISSYITNLGNGNNNQYIVPANGYIWLHFTSINSALCYAQTSGGLTNYAQTFARYSGDGQLYAFFPVRKDDYFIVQIYTSSTAVVQNAYFIPCQGNI